jgi:hypothetical protein
VYTQHGYKTLIQNLYEKILARSSYSIYRVFYPGWYLFHCVLANRGMVTREIIGFVFLGLLPFLDGIRDGETLATNSRVYHKVGYVVRACIAVLLLWSEWFWIPLYAAYFWIIFDLSWNITAHQNLFYVGKTASLDKAFGYKIYVAKIALLVGATLLLLFQNKL